MGEYRRSIGRKPAGRTGGGYRADGPRGRYGDRPAGRFGARPEGRFGSRPGGRFGGRPEGRFRRDGDQPLEMHEVVCDKCGMKTTVPFKPTSTKPVYCRDCFTKKEGSFARPRDRPNYSAGDLEKINEKLDKIMKALKID